jgi:3-hydroxyisobutyrate dehydrogenase
MKISVVGTGQMGTALGKAWLKAGHQVTVFNRTREKTKPLAALGATVGETAADAINASEFIVLVLFDAESTNTVVLHDSVKAVLAGRALINVAATTAAEINKLARAVAEAGGNLAEVTAACYPLHVSEGAGEFIIASDLEYCDQWKRIFSYITPKVHYIGPVGNASKAEMALWLPYLFQTISVAYAAAAFENEGLPLDTLQALMSDNPVVGVGGAEYLIPFIRKRFYDSKLASVNTIIATCDMVIENARNMGLPTAVFKAIKGIYEDAANVGLGEKDVTAIYEIMNPVAMAKGICNLG